MSHKYVLYIGKDNHDPSVFCRGSKVLLDLIKPYESQTLIQDVEILLEKGVNLPEWLDGTPILVDMSTKQAMKGSEAARYVQDLQKKESFEKSSQRESDSPPSMEEMTGVLASGERLLHEDTNFDPAPPDAETMKLTNRDEKITDADLEKYMEMRNRGQPPAPSQ